ncbi:serine/threonine-protein kinase [Sporobolomyces salmoneus]|uniref:serine/threonine-protein kinase n=1 Tax=Sporobolomyces salmoneus TaxID=183962 RepID=UPI003180320E
MATVEDPLGSNAPTPPTWIDYSPPRGGGFASPASRPAGGSTFFFPTGSQLVSNSPPATPHAVTREALPDLPFPRSILLSSPATQGPPLPFSSSSTSPSNRSPPSAPALSYAPDLPRPTLPPSMRTTTKVPLAQSSSPLIAHSGFWDILSGTGSRFYSPSKINTRVQGAKEEQRIKGRTERIGKGIASRPVGSKEPIQGGISFATKGEEEGKREREKRRVSKDLIGEPRAFAHLVHASDAEQAEALLMRWHLDKQGKLGQPSWAKPIKSAVREAKAAIGINEVMAQRQVDQEPGTLQVTNGLPDSAFSHVVVEGEKETSIDTGVAVENDSGKLSPLSSPFRLEPLPPLARSTSGDTIVISQTPRESIDTIRPLPGQLQQARKLPRVPPPQLETPPAPRTVVIGTTKFSPHGYNRPGVPLSWDTNENTSSLLLTSNESNADADDSGFFSLSDPFSLPAKFLPSLTTIEKAVSTKIYLETKYHALLKTPPSRETRKHLLEKELSRLNLREDQKAEVRNAWKLSETEYLRDMRTRVNVGSFKKLKVIGRGAFGVVSLVRETGSGELYAMKQLRKSDMLRKGQEGHIRAERDLLASAACSTRWTVRLAYSFQDVDHLYLVMDAMLGGDLLTLLIEKDTFEESFAKFYIAEMVLALQETHQVLGAIHRDVKPDNFLFDKSGHIAISDFGLSTDFHWSHDGAYFDSHRRELLYKHGIDLEDNFHRSRAARAVDGNHPPFDPPRPDTDENENEGPKSVLGWRDKQRRRLAYSVVGTNNYMAIEVLRGTGYGVEADWWSLGVIMFEMLYGYPPFVSKSRQQTRQKILNWRQSLRFPSKARVSREAQDLILSLICEKEDRLGSRRNNRPNSVIQRQRSGFLNVAGPGGFTTELAGVTNDGADQIKNHPWFKGIDWARLHLETPPFQPQLRSETDTRYFEDDIEAVPLPAPEIAPGVPAPDTTRDPMLRHATEGDQLLELRKSQGFKNWTFKRPKKQVYDPRRGLDLSQSGDIFGKANDAGTYRGRSTLRSDGFGSSFARSLSV